MRFWERSGGRAAFLALALALAVAVLYWPSTDFDYVNIDDHEYTCFNPAVAGGLNGENLAGAFTTIPAGFWMPLTWLSYQADVSLYGMNPAGFHFTNLLLHAVNAALFLLVLHRLTGAEWRSALAAALWSLHPLRVESVAWITERKDVLSVFFLLLALLAYERWVRTGRMRWHAALLLSFAAGLMSKSMLVTFPVLLLILDFWPLGRMGGGKGWSHAVVLPLLREKIPLFLMSAATAVLTMLVMPTWKEPIALFARLQRMLSSVFAYLGSTFWPRHLHYATYYPARDPVQLWLTIVAASGVLLISMLVYRAGKRHPVLVFGWAWYLVALLPVAGMIPTGTQLTADRFTLVPHLGLMTALSWTAAVLVPGKSWSRLLAAGLTGAVLLMLGFLTARQLPVWSDGLTMLEHSLRYSPRDFMLRSLLGEYHLSRNRLPEAEAQFRLSLAVGPDRPEARMGLADALRRQSRREEALEQAEAAVRLRPDDPSFHYDLAFLLLELGRRPEAITRLAETVRLMPGHAAARLVLAENLFQERRLAEAFEQFAVIRENFPTEAEGIFARGRILEIDGRKDEAREAYRRAREIPAAHRWFPARLRDWTREAG
jgi:tetratricopeptide (TPR) repeat protein